MLASIPIAYAFDALTLGQVYAVEFVAGFLPLAASSVRRIRVLPTPEPPAVLGAADA